MFLRPVVRVVVLVAFAACGPTTPRDGGTDTGIDAGVDAADAGTDAGLDAERDGGVDAGPSDPRWVAVPGVVEGCSIDRATNPASLARATWESCGEGCQRLVPDSAWTWRVAPNSGGRSEDQRTFVMLARERGVVDGPAATILFDAEAEAPLFAMRYDDEGEDLVCQILSVAFGEGHVAFPLVMTDFGRSHEETWVFHGAVDRPGELEAPVLRLADDELPGFGNVLQRSYVSATTAAFQVQPLGEMWLVEGGVLRRRAEAGSEAPNSPQGPALVGRHLMWLDFGAKAKLAHATFDTPSEIFLDVPDADVVFATDGVDLAWVQGYGWNDATGTYERLELWTAPYVTAPEALVPRRVLDDYAALDTRGVVGARRWVAVIGNSELEVVDLRDGTRTTMVLSSEHVMAAPPSWITESEVGVAGRYREGGRWVDSFFRLALPSEG
ncbi:MAG: hypothetical protein H6720_31290 [Sandaracinus sp.]|nr:hypothetical protein [Sandaracinus sp.]